MAERAVVHVKLSSIAERFMLAALDLLQAVEHADRALISDETLAAAERLRRIVDGAPGSL